MEQQQIEAPSLSISDLVLLLNLVRVTAERGAIKADEMAVVGAVYEKLQKFLQANNIATQPPVDAQAPAAPEAN